MMNTDKLDRIALEVAKEMYPHWPGENVKSSALPEFARRLVARLQQEAEPAKPCVCCANGNDLPDGEWCRACGRSRESALSRAVRLARGSNEPPNFPVAFDSFPPAQPAQSAEVQEGMALVPKEPTDAMLRAAMQYDSGQSPDENPELAESIATDYRLMIEAAAPARPVVGEGE